MGCFSYSCSISGLPIEDGTPVRFMALASGVGHRLAVDIAASWQPMMLPIRARYNDYGSIDQMEEGQVTEAFFESLDRRALRRDVGEDTIHDVVVTASMSRDDWLTALSADRVQVHGPDLRKLDVVQSMVREDIWGWLTQNSYPHIEAMAREHVRAYLNLDTLLEREALGDEAFDEPLRELLMVAVALRRLGRPWARGTCCGPQLGDWDYQLGFTKELAEISKRYVVRLADKTDEEE